MRSTIIKSNIKYIINNSVKCTCGLFAIGGFIGLFVPFSEYMSKGSDIWHRIFMACLVLAVVWTIIFVIFLIIVCFKKQYKLFELNNGHAVYVQYGDVFSENEIEGKNKKRNIVIPVNRCFDTIVDDDLISSNTVHGKCLEILYNNGHYTQQALNKCIQDFLTNRRIPFEKVDRECKRSGNLKRYEVGTVAEVKDANKTYFFLGLTEFDENLHAHTSDEQYVLALIRLLHYNNKRSMQFPLIIPLIGAGAADTRKSEQDILEFLVKLLKMNRNLINSDVHIVVRSTAKNNVAIADL